MTATESILAGIAIIATALAAGQYLWFRQRLLRLEQLRQQDKEKHRHHQSARLTVLEYLPEALLMLDERQEIIRANRTARLMFGDCAGRRLNSIVWEATLLDAVDTALPDERQQITEYHDIAHDRWYRVWLQPLPPQTGMRTRLLLVFSDHTAVKRSQQANADFVANASHELKTPLASIAGFLETLKAGAWRDEGVCPRFLDIMERETRRMIVLVNDLLALSVAERTDTASNSETTALLPLLDEVLSALEPLAADRKITFQRNIACTTSAPDVPGNRQEWTQVLRNILDNAVKYAWPETIIIVRLETGRNETLCLSVTNTGEGIVTEDIPRITQRFFRTRTARDSGIPGTGLGLALVKNIVQRHGGTLDISSVPGASVTATVTIPVATEEFR